jgi:hypothetical protein
MLRRASQKGSTGLLRELGAEIRADPFDTPVDYKVLRSNALADEGNFERDAQRSMCTHVIASVVQQFCAGNFEADIGDYERLAVIVSRNLDTQMRKGR